MPAIDELSAAFGLAAVTPVSLTSSGQVFRGRTASGDAVVLKRTAAAPDRAHAIAGWTTSLAQQAIRVVAPVMAPRRLADAYWVAYPYIEGRPYGTHLGDVRAAGDLLGRIHAAAVPDDVIDGLRYYEWPDTPREDVDADLEVLLDRCSSALATGSRAASDALSTLAERWWSESLPALEQADDDDPLPRVAASCGYRADNLVYDADGHPTLIDPDNGGYEPRLLDLALAVVLFHNECPTAPARMIDSHEWHELWTAYSAHVTLTDRERALWPAAIDHMLWEEGTWVLEDNDDAAWADPRQGGFLRDLAVTTPDRYPLV